MKIRFLYASLLVFVTAGLLDSLYLSYTALTHTALTCNITGLDGCNIVAQSSYSHFLGIPLGVFGVLFYVMIFVAIAATHRLPTKIARQALMFFTTTGLLLSVYFMGIQVFVIRAVCIYCVASFIFALLLWATSLSLFKQKLQESIVINVPSLP